MGRRATPHQHLVVLTPPGLGMMRPSTKPMNLYVQAKVTLDNPPACPGVATPHHSQQRAHRLRQQPRCQWSHLPLSPQLYLPLLPPLQSQRVPRQTVATPMESPHLQLVMVPPPLPASRRGSRRSTRRAASPTVVPRPCHHLQRHRHLQLPRRLLATQPSMRCPLQCRLRRPPARRFPAHRRPTSRIWSRPTPTSVAVGRGP